MQITLSKRKGVCNDYSHLFKRLCELTNIECIIITGIGKTNKNQIGRINMKSNHAWNAVKLSGKWHLIDVTWGAGYVDLDQFDFEFKEGYFMSPPEKFCLKSLS